MHALLFDPGGMGYARPLRHVHAAFPRLESVGSRDAVISGLYHTAYTRAISSFVASVARALRKTRFRLVASLYRVGLTTPLGPSALFQDGFPCHLSQVPRLLLAHQDLTPLSVTPLSMWW